MFLLGCGGLRGPTIDPAEHVRGEHTRLIHHSVDELWPALERALDDEGFDVERTDRKRGLLSTRERRYTERDVLKRLPQIGDLSGLHGATGVSELVVAYQLVLRPAEDTATRLTIRSTLAAVDRNQAVFLGPGLFQVVPRRIPIPSRGLLERELLRRLGGSLFTSEEMLFLLGEPGVD